MHLHFEEPSSRDSRGRQRLRCDSVITSLSWMGRVPDEQPEVSFYFLLYLFISFFYALVLLSSIGTRRKLDLECVQFSMHRILRSEHPGNWITIESVIMQ